MIRKINILNGKAFISALSGLKCAETPFAELNSKDFEIPFFELNPIEGYEKPVNKETGEQFPNCCQYHKSVYKGALEWFEKFPNCCVWHRNLIQKPWFNKEDYKDIPLKIVEQVSNTECFIEKQIETSDWYKDITDYLHANISSFGQLPEGNGGPVGLHIYFGTIKRWLEKSDPRLAMDKRKRLVEFLETYEKPSKTTTTDLNILYSTYHKWIKIFPFGISYFSELKEFFSNQLPFLSEQPEYNKYLKAHYAKAQTQAGLIEVLTNTTKSLLEKIDTVELVEKNLIADTNKHRIELLNANHRLNQTSLLSTFSKGELKYVKVLKKWLSGEKEYFMTIIPLVKSRSENNSELPSVPVIKPIFQPQAIPIIFDILKGFFSTGQQNELEQILLSGGNAKEPLIFLDNGSRLADAFKQLYDADFVMGCQKKELECWIEKNYLFRFRNKVKKFRPRYLSDIISTKKDKCQNPILNVKMEKVTGTYLISKA